MDPDLKVVFYIIAIILWGAAAVALWIAPNVMPKAVAAIAIGWIAALIPTLVDALDA